MKKSLVFFAVMILVCGLLMAGCGSGGGTQDVPLDQLATLPLESTTTMRVGETRRVGNLNTTIKLDAVTSDTRCPENANCAVAGTLTARLLVSDSATKNEVFLLPSDVNGVQIPRTQTRIGLALRVRDIEPRFGPTGNPTTEADLPQKDYKISIAVAAEYM